MLLDFAKMIVIRSFNRLLDLRKRNLFVRRHRNIHFLILSLPILLMVFERNVENSFLFPIYGSIIFVVGKSPMDIMEPILL